MCIDETMYLEEQSSDEKLQEKCLSSFFNLFEAAS